MLQKVCCCICFTLISLTSCSSKALDLTKHDDARRLNANSAGAEKLHYLDLKNPSISQPIDASEKGLAGYKFVEVEVAEVSNPKNHPVTFEIHYQTSGREKLLLGSFGLYPSNGTGKFIVATQRKLKDEGAIVLTLVTLEKAESGDTIRVGIKRIKFLKG